MHLFCLPTFGQIQITESNPQSLSPAFLVENVFLGRGVQILDIKYRGSLQSIGQFSGALDHIGIEQGIVLSTGLVSSIAAPNLSGNTGGSGIVDTIYGDRDLEAIATEKLGDIASLEIEFIPQASEIEFRYVFASEEYPEFVCSDFNDIFAFFISGPNPNGADYNAQNIALVPDPNDLDTENYTSFHVATNTVNNGMAGSASQGSDCSGPGQSLEFSQYYNENSSSVDFAFDGYLDVFTARASVVPCRKYKIKLIIADSRDFDLDSGVFLAAQSFSTNGYTYNFHMPGIGDQLYQGCLPMKASINFSEPVPTARAIPLELIYKEGGQFKPLPANIFVSADTFFIEEGHTMSEIEISLNNDSPVLTNGVLGIVQNVNGCIIDTFEVKLIQDLTPQSVHLARDSTYCGGSFRLDDLYPIIDSLFQYSSPSVLQELPE